MNSTRTLSGDILVRGLLASLFIALYKSLDNVVVHNYITGPDNLTAAFGYLIVGGWTGVIMGVIYALFLGKKLIDPDFKSVNFSNKKMHAQAFLAGSFGAMSTLFMLLGHQFGDPSAVVALSSLVLVYTAIYDVWKGNIQFRNIALPLVAAIVGAFFVAFNGSVEFSLNTILLIGGAACLLSAGSEITGQKGSRASDGVNLFIWRFFWLATMGTVIALITTTVRGYMPLLVETLAAAMQAIPLIIVVMFFVFLGDGIKETLKRTNAVSVILLIASAQIAWSLVLSFFGAYLVPNAFGNTPTELVVWGLKLLGCVLLIFGIIRLRMAKPDLAKT